MTGDYVTHADLGGQLGHGSIRPERGGEAWHMDWERRVMALTLAMGATRAWNLDMARAARETLSDYRSRTYYAVWFGALQKQLMDCGLVSADELDAGRALHPSPPVPRVLQASAVASVLARGAPTERLATTGPHFAVGQRVRTKVVAASRHTRLPGYAMGKLGVIERLHGVHVFADANASGEGEQPQWLYTVAFTADQLWPDAQLGLTVSIDAWEPYLEAA